MIQRNMAWLTMSNDSMIIHSMIKCFILQKGSEISTEWKFLKGRPPIYIFERACPALMAHAPLYKKSNWRYFRETRVACSEKDLMIRWYNCIHCFMKRNRKYQLNENPSVGGLEHTFANARISSRITQTSLRKTRKWFSFYDVPT